MTSVAVLVHRLAECPPDFLEPPAVGAAGVVNVAGVVGDTLRRAGSELPEAWIDTLRPSAAAPEVENWLRACLVSCWLVSDLGLTAAQLLGFFAGDLNRTASLVRADLLVHDDDRREELARLLLRSIGQIPEGESEDQAADRLATIDSVTRTRVEAEARAAEQRSREVRAALERKRAEEAAARASRE